MEDGEEAFCSFLRGQSLSRLPRVEPKQVESKLIALNPTKKRTRWAGMGSRGQPGQKGPLPVQCAAARGAVFQTGVEG